MNKRTLVPMENLIRDISMGPFGSDVKVNCFVDSGVPILNGLNLTTIKMNDDAFRYVTREKADSLYKALAHRGDIIVTHRGTLGQLSYVPKDSKYEEYLISQSQFRVTLNTDIINPVYFAYYFHSTEGQKRLLSFANYVGVPALASATTNFRNLQFPWIPLIEQNKIADILLEIDNKIENNDAISVQLESLAKTIYDYWFLQFEFPNEDGKPYKSSGGKMVWNEELKREIPEGWEVTSLRGKYNIERGISYTSKDIESGKGLPMLNLACIDTSRNYRDGELKYTTECVTESEKLHGGELLIACTDLTRNADIVGCPILVPQDGKTYTYSMDLAKIYSTASSLTNMYLYQSLRTDFYHRYIKKWASGTNVLHLNLDGLNWYSMALPPVLLQKKYASLISTIEKKKSDILAENRQLTSLRDFLLPLLMNGQVTFKDEAASEEE